ncbi:MAG TPA: abortive infection family protein [Candidatus Hodarchaeales archaeon]|nr:abortive infection family protein [Candidatus Hodarchaeales archaeon]
MNLQLNAKQNNEIETILKKAQLQPEMFEYSTRQSECVSVYVRHAYRALDGYEPTTAQAICLRANSNYFFTFERDDKNVFFASCFPELDIGPIIKATQWDGLLSAFCDWLEVLKVQIEADNIAPTKSQTFLDMLHSRDLSQIKNEFRRAEQQCTYDPPTAVAAASSMIESACKLYIADHSLSLPMKATIKPLWSLVSKDILSDYPAIVKDDIQRLLSGLTSVVDGLGSLRTHASSAHGRDRSEPEVGVPEALLAIHASQTLVLFMLQKWK